MAKVNTSKDKTRIVRDWHAHISCDYHDQLMVWNGGDSLTEEEKQEIQSAAAFNVLASYLYGAKFPTQRV